MAAEPALAALPARAASGRPRVALVGNPNTGKTSLFNRLCGVRAKTANFPGTTTDVRFGRSQLGVEADPYAIELIDLPGLYRLGLDLPESRMVDDLLAGRVPYQRPDAVLVVVDATNLVRNLYLVGEVLRAGLPTVVALNMIDLAQQRMGLFLIARDDRDRKAFARQRMRDRPRRAAGANDSRHAIEMPLAQLIAQRLEKAAEIGVEAGKAAVRFVADGVDRPDLFGGGIEPVEQRQYRLLVWNRDVATAPVGIGAALGKIGRQLVRPDMAALVVPRDAELLEPEIVDQRRFAMRDRIADDLCVSGAHAFSRPLVLR